MKPIIRTYGPIVTGFKCLFCDEFFPMTKAIAIPEFSFRAHEVRHYYVCAECFKVAEESCPDCCNSFTLEEYLSDVFENGCPYCKYSFKEGKKFRRSV